MSQTGCYYMLPSGYFCGEKIVKDVYCWKHYKQKNPTEEKSIKDLLQQRGSIYGDVKDNMNCATELIIVAKEYMNKNTKYEFFKEKSYDRVGWEGCMIMVFHKLARICTGGLHEDNYKDVAGYIELARKIAMGEPTEVIK